MPPPSSIGAPRVVSAALPTHTPPLHLPTSTATHLHHHPHPLPPGTLSHRQGRPSRALLALALWRSGLASPFRPSSDWSTLSNSSTSQRRSPPRTGLGRAGGGPLVNPTVPPAAVGCSATKNFLGNAVTLSAAVSRSCVLRAPGGRRGLGPRRSRSTRGGRRRGRRRAAAGGRRRRRRRGCERRGGDSTARTLALRRQLPRWFDARAAIAARRISRGSGRDLQALGDCLADARSKLFVVDRGHSSRASHRRRGGRRCRSGLEGDDGVHSSGAHRRTPACPRGARCAGLRHEATGPRCDSLTTRARTAGDGRRRGVGRRDDRRGGDGGAARPGAAHRARRYRLRSRTNKSPPRRRWRLRPT